MDEPILDETFERHVSEVSRRTGCTAVQGTSLLLCVKAQKIDATVAVSVRPLAANSQDVVNKYNELVQFASYPCLQFRAAQDFLYDWDKTPSLSREVSASYNSKNVGNRGGGKSTSF
jgi:hypothetical protein